MTKEEERVIRQQALHLALRFYEEGRLLPSENEFLKFVDKIYKYIVSGRQ